MEIPDDSPTKNGNLARGNNILGAIRYGDLKAQRKRVPMAYVRRFPTDFFGERVSTEGDIHEYASQPRNMQPQNYQTPKFFNEISRRCTSELRQSRTAQQSNVENRLSNMEKASVNPAPGNAVRPQEQFSNRMILNRDQLQFIIRHKRIQSYEQSARVTQPDRLDTQDLAIKESPSKLSPLKKRRYVAQGQQMPPPLSAQGSFRAPRVVNGGLPPLKQNNGEAQRKRHLSAERTREGKYQQQIQNHRLDDLLMTKDFSFSKQGLRLMQQEPTLRLHMAEMSGMHHNEAHATAALSKMAAPRSANHFDDDLLQEFQIDESLNVIPPKSLDSYERTANFGPLLAAALQEVPQVL